MLNAKIVETRMYLDLIERVTGFGLGALDAGFTLQAI